MKKLTKENLLEELGIMAKSELGEALTIERGRLFFKDGSENVALEIENYGGCEQSRKSADELSGFASYVYDLLLDTYVANVSFCEKGIIIDFGDKKFIVLMTKN